MPARPSWFPAAGRSAWCRRRPRSAWAPASSSSIRLHPVAKRQRSSALRSVDPTSDGVAERIRELTGGRGADLVVEASGHDASLADAFDFAREEGRMSMVGINIGRKVPVLIGKIQMKNLTVRGCIGSPGVWPAAIRFLERTKLDLSPIQTHEFPLAQAVEAFEFGKDPRRLSRSPSRLEIGGQSRTHCRRNGHHRKRARRKAR